MKLRHTIISSLIAASAIFNISTAFAETSTLGYYRAPALNGNVLAFTAEGDIWTQSLGTKNATASRLTSLPNEELNAKISNDGKWLAFVANYDGVQEIYVIATAGGMAKRVSFENSRVRLQGWTASGHILYATDNAQGPSNYWVLRSVNPKTLQTQDIPLADAIEGVTDPESNYIYFIRFGLQTTGDNLKVYRGGAKGELWRYQLGKNTEAQQLVTQHNGSIRNPMLWNKRIYFVSDQDGNANIWSVNVDGSDLKQVTKYKDFEVRSPYLNEGRIVFQKGADIYLWDLASNTEQKLDIHLTSDFAQRREKWVNEPLDYATSINLSPTGNKVVITARSHVAVASSDGSRLVELATDGSYRLRNAVMGKSGKWVYAISDESGEQELWRYPANGSGTGKQLTTDASSLRMSLVLSPDGRYLAHDDYQGNLWLYDIKKESNRKIVTDNEGLSPYIDISWSPDSRYLALTRSKIGSPRSQVMLYAINSEKSQLLTTDKYESFSPSFSTDGQWLYFLSNRAFNATPSSPWGDRNMGPVFDKRTQIFALALDESAIFPFEKPNELQDITSEQADDPQEVEVEVDWDGLNQRLWQVPVAAGNYQQLTATPEGLYVLDVNESSLNWIQYDNLDPKITLVGENILDYQLDTANQKLFIQQNDSVENIFITEASDTLPDDMTSAKVTTEQWQLALNPVNEWQQIFEDAWLMHRDSFFDPNMRGNDWNATKKKYQPLVNRLTDRYELNDIFTQMMGELNALHSQVRGGDLAYDDTNPQAANLGARLTQTKAGVEIAHIYRTDPELPAQASPLMHAGVNAKDGDIITQVNGKKINTLAELTALLRNQANKPLLLTLKRGRSEFKNIVYPVDVKENGKLRYLDWVNSNAEKVAKASNNKIGYLHLYAMGKSDIESFAREFYANYEKSGLIIDVRRNRGGNIDSWIIEKLLRRAWAFWQPTVGTPYPNMQQTFRGHLVVLTDQLTYSDGETFSAGIKALGIAPLIGKPTAGAGVWLSGRNRLTDNGMARVAEYPQYSLDGRWIVEGKGVSPDIEVDNLPLATFMGTDAQLNSAIDYLNDELIREPIGELKALPLPKTGEANDVNPPM